MRVLIYNAYLGLDHIELDRKLHSAQYETAKWFHIHSSIKSHIAKEI